jgi:hypothetical protein
LEAILIMTVFTEMFGCMGVVIVCPLNGATIPGTDSHTGLAASMGMGPEIFPTGMVTGWETASGICASVARRAPVIVNARNPIFNSEDLGMLNSIDRLLEKDSHTKKFID